LITRGGYDWTKRYPWIAEAARKNRIKQFVIDGEAVVLGVDGISDFNDLHSGKHDDEVQFCAFDILAEGGDDLRKVPLHLRKTSLDRLLARRPEGIFVNPFERGEIGPDLFQAACDMGLEGLVTKHWDRPYQGGRSKHWVKVKNRGASCDEPRDVKCAPAAGDLRHGQKEGAILGHSTAAATEVYAHLQHDPSKIAADRVSGTISAALNGNPTAQIVPLRRA
jgi:bifunctional non-homologous end joining protein LigD